MSRVAAIRAVLASGRAYTTAELEARSGVPLRHIAALLAHDVREGRVIKSDDWPKTFRQATVAEMEAGNVARARALLERHGYTVFKV